MRKVKGAFTLEPQVLRGLKKIAAAEDRSVSNVVNRILKEAINAANSQKRRA